MVNNVKFAQMAARQKLMILLMDDISYEEIEKMFKYISTDTEKPNKEFIITITDDLKKCLDT